MPDTHPSAWSATGAASRETDVWWRGESGVWWRVPDGLTESDGDDDASGPADEDDAYWLGGAGRGLEASDGADDGADPDDAGSGDAGDAGGRRGSGGERGRGGGNPPVRVGASGRAWDGRAPGEHASSGAYRPWFSADGAGDPWFAAGLD